MKKLSLFLLFTLLFTAGCVKVTIEKDEEKGLAEKLLEGRSDKEVVNTPAVANDTLDQKSANDEQIKSTPPSDQGNDAAVEKNETNNVTNNQANSLNQVEKNMQEQEQAENLKYNPYKFEDLVSKYNQAILKTSEGDIKVVLFKESPFTVNNFLNLAKLEYYTDTTFHRVIKNFMIQGGDINSKDDDPTNDGMGGPGYYFQDEFNDHKLVAGSLAMANSGPNSNGSQFFIVTAEATDWLDGKHTNFGHVIEGMEIVRSIEATEVGANDRPAQPIKIIGIQLIEGTDNEAVDKSNDTQAVDDDSAQNED